MPVVDEPFGTALKRHLHDQGRTYVWLSRAVAEHTGQKPIDPTVVGRWVSGEYQPPDPPVVFAIEAALGLAPGTLSRPLGYVPAGSVPEVTVPGAVEADPRLTVMGRRVVLKVYEEFVGGGSDGP